MSKKITSFKVEWLKENYSRLRVIYSKEDMSNDELKEFLLSEYDKRSNPIGRFFNNVTNDNKEMNVENFINYYLNNDYILTGYNVLIKNQETSKPVAIEALKYILAQRKVYKNKMEEALKGSDEYTYYRVMQLTFKILANSYYGVLSMEGSLFYNPHIQNSITTTGQDLISSAIYLVESFIANNEAFNNLDEIISFIVNVSSEKYSLINFIDLKKTQQEVFDYLVNHSDFKLSDNNKNILNKYLSKLSEESLNKIYYKNQIIELFKNSYFKNKLLLLCNTSNDIKDSEFIKQCIDILNYNHIAWDRFIRISQQKRKASIVTDTDSTFIYLGNLTNALMTNNNISKDNKQNLLNLLISLITEALARTFEIFTANCNIPTNYHKIINMKNEFIYSRLLTTKNKKNYAGWLQSELGKPIPGTDPSIHLDIKGLAIRKSVVAKTLRSQFQELLVNDILLPEKIDPVTVINNYRKISNSVEQSIRDGKTEYLIPRSVDSFDKYVNPASIEQVKASIIWNALEPNNAIVPPDNVKIVKINAPTAECAGLLKLKEMCPDKYTAIINTVFTTNPGELNISKDGITAIAIPLDIKSIPTYIQPLIDIDKMINTNMKNANILLSSLGMGCFDDSKNKTNYKSNIVEWI